MQGSRGDNVKGRAVQAYAPGFPFPKEENWYFVLADPTANAVMSFTKVSLLEAEAAGAAQASASEGALVVCSQLSDVDSRLLIGGHVPAYTRSFCLFRRRCCSG